MLINKQLQNITPGAPKGSEHISKFFHEVISGDLHNSLGKKEEKEMEAQGVQVHPLHSYTDKLKLGFLETGPGLSHLGKVLRHKPAHLSIMTITEDQGWVQVTTCTGGELNFDFPFIQPYSK